MKVEHWNAVEAVVGGMVALYIVACWWVDRYR